MLKLPPRVTIALGTLIAGGAALSLELSLSPPVHKVVLLVAGAILFVVDPTAKSPTLETPATSPTSTAAAPLPPA
jgi:hypothetical protein